MSENVLQRRPKTAPAASHAPKPKSPAAVAQSAASAGGALDTRTQRQMSSRFGHDFGSVRIHTDSHAAQAAKSLNAKAYTAGSDIVFAEGRYAPGTTDGDRLLAHELTHVVQQAQHGPGGEDRLSRSEDESEREADLAASEAIDGGIVRVQARPQAALARDEEDHSTRDYLINMATAAGGFLPGPLGIAAGALGGEESIRTLPGQNDPLADMKNVEGGLGFANGVLGTAAGMAGFDAAGAVGIGAGAEGLGAGAVLGGAGLEGAAALGPAGLVLGAGLAGAATGHMLAEHTEVGQDSVDTIGGVDSLLTGAGDRSAMLRLDEYRQDQWDAGGLGYAKSVGAGVAEGAVGLAGAVGGLAEGAYHGIGAIGSGIADLLG